MLRICSHRCHPLVNQLSAAAKSNYIKIYAPTGGTLFGTSSVYHQQINKDIADMTRPNVNRQQQIKTHFKGAAKKPARPPLVKNFFSGKVDTEQLTYPEVIARDDMVSLQQDIDTTNRTLAVSIDSATIQTERHIPRAVFEDARNLHLFGLTIDPEYGGQGMAATQVALASESEAADVNVAYTLNAHRLACRIISECGTAAQRTQFLPKLAAGDLIGTIAFYESESPDNGIFSTRATEEQNTWTLNG